jgi:hypothetical protein
VNVSWLGSIVISMVCFLGTTSSGSRKSGAAGCVKSTLALKRRQATDEARVMVTHYTLEGGASILTKTEARPVQEDRNDTPVRRHRPAA